MNIDMIYDAEANEGLESQEAIMEKMSSLIEEYCGSTGVNSILVSLPGSGVADALEICKEKNIPIAAFNAG